MNDAFDSVFDKEDADYEEDSLVNQVYDEIGLEFSESVMIRNIFLIFIAYLRRLKLHRQDLQLLIPESINLIFPMTMLINLLLNLKKNKVKLHFSFIFML